MLTLTEAPTLAPWKPDARTVMVLMVASAGKSVSSISMAGLACSVLGSAFGVSSVFGASVAAGAGASALGASVAAGAGASAFGVSSVFGASVAAGAGASVFGASVAAGAGVSALGASVAAGAGVSALGASALGASALGASVFGASVAAGAGASVFGASVEAGAGAVTSTFTSPLGCCVTATVVPFWSAGASAAKVAGIAATEPAVKAAAAAIL